MQTGIHTISLWLMILLYVFAGINHFLRPKIYIKIMPSYFPAKKFLNIAAGIAEITLGIALYFDETRYWAAWIIMAMLTSFFPVHIHMQQLAPFKMGKFTLTKQLAFIRTLLQFVLIYWAYTFTR
ncbi:MAG: DoxX family protein [Sphingobacteriales bacterium]|uniref:DoxX family protein n=1 Tax=Hydrotalea flava TaxID=714549 RepID=UPI00083109C8|nr:MauE/DoxX family redox-associated membrane protein [Hydrotalea flava]RTL54844.1 MAG: DoxX family protein [Sphingobacteriales bacterium]